MELAAVFQKYFTDRKGFAASCVEAALAGAHAPYYDPAAGMQLDRYLPNPGEALSTSELDQGYTAAREAGASGVEVGLLSLEHSVVSAARRDFMFRRRTRVRARAAALSRLQAQGLDEGVLTGSSLSYVMDQMTGDMA